MTFILTNEVTKTKIGPSCLPGRAAGSSQSGFQSKFIVNRSPIRVINPENCYENVFVYIVASKRNGTIYIGVTSNLSKRIQEHKDGEVDGFTKKYSVNKLVYYESTTDVYVALKREKNLKEWKRCWKVDLIEKHNLLWKDLSYRFTR